MKIRHLLYLGFFLIFLSGNLHAQNRADYFKVLPIVTNITPDWAQSMYEADPSVNQVDKKYQAYYTTNAFEETIHTRNYSHWRKTVDSWINEAGLIRRPSPTDFLSQFSKKTTASANKIMPWVPIGPFETYNDGSQGSFPVSWQVNVYAMDQSVSDPNIVFAGTEAGGVFKSIDKGLSWNLVSAETSILTVQDIKVAASDPNLVICASNDIIYKSTNGGLSWTEAFLLGNGIYQLAIDPANPATMFCASQAGLFRSTDTGDTWEQLNSGVCWDIKFQPENPSTVYALRTNNAAKRAEFFKSIDGGDNWILQETGWYAPTDFDNASDGGGRIAVTPADPNRVYVALIGQSKTDDNGWIGVYRSYDAGQSWANPDLPDGGPYNNEDHQNLATINKDGTGFHQGFYNFSLAASHQDADRLWVGTLSLNVSDDAGENWLRIGSYSSGTNDIGWIHPDIQDLHVLGADVWVCSDGGMNYSDDELMTHESRKTGIYGSDFWGFGQGWNQDVLVGGRYHNGNSGYYQTYGVGNTLRLGGAEAPTGYVNPLHERTAYFSDISTKVLPEMIDGPVPSLGSLGLYPNESYTVSYSSEVVIDPRYANHFYIGNSNKIWKSTNEGGYFEAIYTFPVDGRVLELEINREDPNRMYCVFHEGDYYWDPCDIYGSTNGGESWGKLPALPTNNTFRVEITNNPKNPDELWAITVNGDVTTKVFQTINGGATWTDRSTPEIADGDLRDIQFQGGTESLVYLTTTRGVFYWDGGAENWVDYSGGLPLRTRALEMIPFYRDSKIRLSTGGRGIWEAPMAAPFEIEAQPMTETDEIYCSRDTVQFDCYSFLDHTDASWNWDFNPAPNYISDVNSRNPSVVFGEEGSYDVTLTITDAFGESSSKTIPDMVQVENFCVLDTVPGFSFRTSEIGDYATTPNLDVHTNSFTFSAWIKPEGIQPEYSSIAMNVDASGGLNFKQNNELGYHWPGGAWWWDSGLTAPSGEWSYVALVVTPDSATVYLNGQQSTHVETMDSITLTSVFLGSYKGWGSRNYFGEIDEVCMWKRALSQEEIREMRHLTKSEQLASDPDFLVYYQFNAPQGDVLDRIGVAHATIRGTANRVVSSVPVASGEVYRGTLTNTDPIVFGETGLGLDYNESADYPMGELVISRLHWSPFDAPNMNPNIGAYWVVNHYGEGDFFGLNNIHFALPFGEWNSDLEENPEKALLYFRAANGFGNTWTQYCLATELSDGLIFGENCNVPEYGQLFIASDDPDFPLLDDGINTSVLALPKDRAKVFPNPADDQIWVQQSELDELRFRLFDASGKLKRDQFCTDLKTAVSVKELAPGIYFYRLEGAVFIQTGKVVVE